MGQPSLSEIFLALSLTAISAEVFVAKIGLIKARYEARDTWAALAMTVGNIATGLAMAGIVYAGLTLAYQHRLISVPFKSPWAWLALFFLDDFTYYWFHRISHECRLWWAAHVNHHSSQRYNLSTALRQTWTGEIVGTWTPWVALALLGFPPQMILFQQGLNLFYQFWIHTEAVGRLPAGIEFVFNTPSHHRVHHGSNPSYLDRNYGGVLIVWDRLFGTFSAERDDEPVRYGLVTNIETHNPLKIAFHEWAAVAHDLGKVRSPRDAAGVLFGPPGWKPDGGGATSASIRAAWERERKGAAGSASSRSSIE